MTKFEMTIRHVSDLRDCFVKIKTQKGKTQKSGTRLGPFSVKGRNSR